MTVADLQSIGRVELQAVLDQRYEPSVPFNEPVNRAAVAVVFQSGATGPEILLIQRAASDGDPWSGHMAFPGGRTDAADPTPESTAVRETHEELDLKLPTEQSLGTLTELDGGRATNSMLLISAHGFWCDQPNPTLTPNYEVAEALWIPLTTLADPQQFVDFYYPPAGTSFPGIRVGDSERVIWGLTLRFLADLFDRLAHPLKLDPTER